MSRVFLSYSREELCYMTHIPSSVAFNTRTNAQRMWENVYFVTRFNVHLSYFFVVIVVSTLRYNVILLFQLNEVLKLPGYCYTNFSQILCCGINRKRFEGPRFTQYVNSYFLLIFNGLCYTVQWTGYYPFKLSYIGRGRETGDCKTTVIHSNTVFT
jgi:hypothetical protein